MRRILCMVLACMSLISCLNIQAGATDIEMPEIQETAGTVIMRASSSFNMSVAANKTTKADSAFSLIAGETVRIRANYAPENASVDFGIIDSEQVFHYVNTKTGSIDTTIEVSENGSYTFAVKHLPAASPGSRPHLLHLPEGGTVESGILCAVLPRVPGSGGL